MSSSRDIFTAAKRFRIGDHADDLAAVRHRQVPEMPGLHHVEGLHGEIVRGQGVRVLRRDFGHGGGAGVQALGHDPVRDGGRVINLRRRGVSKKTDSRHLRAVCRRFGLVISRRLITW
jgi:hypothetical protein